MRHIMVATDGSEGADRAVDVAAELAKVSGGKLFIVTVAGNLSSEEMRELARAERNIDAALEGLSMQILTAAEKRAQRFGVTDIQLQIAWGDPASRCDCAWQARAGPIAWIAAWKCISESCEPRPVYCNRCSRTGGTLP